MPLLVFVVSRVVSVLCVVALGAVVVFDASVERFTAGRVPSQFAQRLDVDLAGRYGNVTGVAHNAGDDLNAATKAVAYGVDAIEIDVRSVGAELFASHDAPVPFLEDLVFRGPSLQDAWNVAQLRDTVLLHLKQSSPRYLTHVRDFLASRPLRRVIIQTGDRDALRTLRRTIPSAQRLLLVLTARDLEALRGDRELLGMIDGVSVRDSLLTGPAQAWLQRRGLLTFAWPVNDERRMHERVARGIDGLITDRFDVMQLLGEGREPIG
ncbi:MAG: Glycerophosphoryl diester phosphodiesterase family [Solirubrobacteraceae bacterium]|nr:Glycerophosphoryl diester phosphodiesterase family [Solirubrobacteraceae bacterium]